MQPTVGRWPWWLKSTLGCEMKIPFNTIAEQHQEIVRIARRILDGSVGIIAGAREMMEVRFLSHSKEKEEDYLVFLGIDSETDHLPVGEVRKHWSAHALAEKDIEIKEAEDFFRESAYTAARRLVQKYEKPNHSQEPP